MEFRILGPLEALAGGRAVELPRQKHRALLAALALRAGEPISADRLIEDLWGENPPRTARDALQNYVSLLRKALGNDALVTRQGAYVLEVDPGQVDAVRFERLAADGRAAPTAEARAEKLRDALALWRGPPLADLAYEPFAAVEIERLEELRLAATQDLIDAELELGKHGDLVPELEALIQQHPFDERLRGQLMLALYRCGRQTEALDAYQAARRMLDDELGLEPGPPLRDLEQAILRHDPALGAAAPVTAQPSRRTVTVLVAGLGEGDPETVAGRLAQVRAVVAQHAGTTGPFAGDAAMAVFGAPKAHEDDALRAVRAARGLGDLRVGVATGEAFVGGEVVAGTPVTAARQLEQAAKPGEVLVSASTLRLVRDAVRCRRTKRRELTAFRVEQMLDGAPAIARQFDTPLVGRTEELAALRGAVDRAGSGCVLFTVVGDAGMGKTRLARELLAELGDDARVLVGRCVSYGEGATFLPLVEMLGHDVLSAGSTGEIFLAARRRFEELSAERPLVLLFEDVHWAEATLLDFVEYLAAQATGSPILALCLARPDLLAERPDWQSSLVLEPLTDDESRELAGGDHAERIVEIAEGNPLYVEQLAAYVAEEGVAALESVPGTIEALLASRVDRLGTEERALAQLAAVVGRRFSTAAVAALGPVDRLGVLEAGRFVHRAGEMYRFHHVLVRDVVYAGTPKSERAELHRQHADWLDEQADGSDELVGFHLEQAAGYLGDLGAPEQQVTRIATNAGRRLGAAGIRAWKRGDARATVSLLGRATALLPTQDAARLELLCELGHAFRAAGELEAAEAVLEDAAEISHGAAERRFELRAELELANVRRLRSSRTTPDDLLDAAMAAIPVLQAVDDHRALGRAWLLAASVHGNIRCHYATCAECAERARDQYEQAGWPAAVCLGLIAAASFYGPMPALDGITRCDELLVDADINGRANIYAFTAGLQAMRGQFVEARDLLDEARSTFRDLGQAGVTMCARIGAEIEVLAGNDQAAEDALRSSCAILERAEDYSYLATHAVGLAAVLYRLGRYTEADAFLQVSKRHMIAGDLHSRIPCSGVEAKLLARRRRFAEGEALARQGVTAASSTDALNLSAHASLDLGEVLILAGDAVAGQEAVAQAVELFGKKGNTVGAGRAQELLVDLSTA